MFGPLPDETWVYPGDGDDTTLGAASGRGERANSRPDDTTDVPITITPQ